MSRLRHRLSPFAALILAGACCTTACFAQTSYRGCAIVDLQKILRDSKASKAAQARLEAEFEPKYQQWTHLASERNRAERAWLDAKAAKRPEAEIDALRAVLDTAAATASAERKAFDAALKRRKDEELERLLGRANDLYRQLGAREQYAKVYQTGERDPVFTPEPDARAYECKEKTDVTAALIREVDAEL